MKTIDRAVLYDNCLTPKARLQPLPAERACAALGPLARWWLARWALKQAHGDEPDYPDLTNPKRPLFPEEPGSCWVVFQNKKRKSLPMLGGGLVLPLCWQKGQHSPQLPKALRELADEVVESLAASPGYNARWGLRLAELPGFDQIHLHDDLPWRYSSGWAALAGGLITLVEGLKPQGNVWATGAWEKGSGLARIGGLPEKLSLAKEWKVRHFFVPESQAPVARNWMRANAPDQIEIGILRRTAEPDPRTTLNQYLATLASLPEDPVAGHPNEEQQFQQIRDYYLHQDAKAARDYYRLHLLPAIVRRCRGRYDRLPLSRHFSHFVTIVSARNELAMVNPLVVRTQNCLLLYHDLEAQARECQRWLEASPDKVTCQLRRFPVGTEMANVLDAAIADFTRGVSRDQVALDLTPGTKMMSYSLSRAAKPGNWLFCLQVDYRYEDCPDGRPVPDSEQPELLAVPVRD